MTTRLLEFIGSIDGWPELAATGKQSRWRVGQIERREESEALQLIATGLFDDLTYARLSDEVAAPVQGLVEASGAGGGATYTRADLIAASIAGTLTPGAWYRTTEGVRAFAHSSSLLSSQNWVRSGVRSAIGGNTSLANLAYTRLPVMGENSRLTIRHRGSFTNSTRSKKLYLLLGGTLTDTVGTSGVDALFDRTFSSATTYDWDAKTEIAALGGATVQSARAVGTTAEGIGSSVSRMLANAQYGAGNCLLRAAGFTVLSGSAVAITGLQISGGYAYGAVAAGTFTDLALLRYGKITGATGTDAAFYNLNPALIDLLTAGLPTPVLAPIGTAASGITAFRYPVTGGSAAASGSPVLELYDDMALESFQVSIEQGSTA